MILHFWLIGWFIPEILFFIPDKLRKFITGVSDLFLINVVTNFWYDVGFIPENFEWLLVCSLLSENYICACCDKV